MSGAMVRAFQMHRVILTLTRLLSDPNLSMTR